MNPMILIFLAILMVIALGQLVKMYLSAPSRYDIRDEDDRR